jgi:signal transduction histidine kinase
MNKWSNTLHTTRTWFYHEDEGYHSEDEVAYNRSLKMAGIVCGIFVVRFCLDAYFIDDALRVAWDALFAGSFILTTYFFVMKRRLQTAYIAFNIIVNGWMFYSANYFGRDGMIVLLMFCTAPYAYYVVGTQTKWLFYFWLILPCINLFALELGDYQFFPNHKYQGDDLSWTRIMVVFSSLTILITLLFSTRMMVVRREKLLALSKDELVKMVDRIENLTDIKEKNNTHLRAQLQVLVDETKRISIQASLDALRSEERERNRISYELVEGLGGLLLAMKYRFETFYPLVEKERIDEYKEVVSLVDKALHELYATCGYLQTEQLKQLGLVEALRIMYRAMEETHGIKVVFENENYSDQLTNEQELIIYRMLVLMINSAVKNANADHCRVDIKHVMGVVYVSQSEDGIEYTDGGVGINGSLRQIRELAALVGGQVRHKSVVGKGASSIVQIPSLQKAVQGNASENLS